MSFIQYLAQVIEVPIVVYTASHRDWATKMVAAMQEVVGFDFVIEGGLFCSDDCQIKLSGEMKVEATGEVKKFANKSFDKSIEMVAGRLKDRFSWVAVDKILMFDDIMPLPPWEAHRHIWVPPYRWSDLSGWDGGVLSTKVVAANEKSDPDMIERAFGYLETNSVCSQDDPELHAKFESCRQIIADVNPTLFESDQLWPLLLAFFKKYDFAAPRGVELLPGRVRNHLGGVIKEKLAGKTKLETTFNGSVVAGGDLVVQSGSVGAIGVNYSGESPACLQMSHNNKVVVRCAVWPDTPHDVMVHDKVTSKHAGRYQCIAVDPWNPEGGESYGKGFKLVVK